MAVPKLEAVAIAAGLSLIIAGAGIVRTELHLFGMRSVMRDVKASASPVAAQELSDAIADIESTGAKSDELRRDALSLKLRLNNLALEHAPGAEAREALLRSAELAARAVAARAPASGQAWCALADLATVRGGFSSEAEDFLKLCFLTAPREAWLVESRLRLAMVLWPRLSPELQALAAEDAAATVRQPDRPDRAVALLGHIAGSIAPQRASMLRAMVSRYQPGQLKVFEAQLPDSRH